MEKTIICIGREYGSGGMPSERFLQNVPGMNSMIKNVSLQLQKNVDLRGKLKNIWKNSR